MATTSSFAVQRPVRNGNPAYAQRENLGFGTQPQTPAPPGQSSSSSGFSMSNPNKDPFAAHPVYASSGGTSNPYLGAQANAITQQANQNLQNNLLPAINSGAVAAGGYGGSRQGIAQGVAMGQTQQGIANSLASMYGSAYQHDQDLANQLKVAQLNNEASLRNAQVMANASMYGANASAGASRYGSDASKAASMYGADTTSNIAKMNNATNYTLGMGNLGLGFQNSGNAYDLGLRANDLGFAGLDANIAQNNFNNQLAGANFGLNAYNALQNNNSLGLTAANNMQNTPLSYYNQFANIANGIGQGFGTTTQNSTAVGNPMLGALGGYQLGSSMVDSLFKSKGSSISDISGSAGW